MSETTVVPVGAITVEEAARRIGLSKGRIQVWLHDGTLEGTKIQEENQWHGMRSRKVKWMVHQESLEALISARNERQSPSGWLTVEAVAAELGVVADYVRKLVQTLPVTIRRQIGTRWFYAPETVEALKACRRSKGQGSSLSVEQKRLVDESGWLTTQQLSERLGISVARLGKLAKAGELPGAIKHGARWVYPPDSVEVRQATKADRQADRRKVEAQDERRLTERLRADGWLTVHEAAQRRGINPAKIRLYACSGRLPSTTFGKRFFFKPEDVDALVTRGEAKRLSKQA